MTLKGRIPVEPLDDDRLVNIERRIVAGAPERMASPERSSRRHLALAGALCAVAAAALIGWRLHGEHPLAPPAPQTLAIRGDGARSTLDLGDATIASDPAAAFDVTRSAGRVDVQVAHGTIELAVEHREGRVLVVHAGDTDIEDVGTRFSVAYDGHDVELRVLEGKVSVTRHQHSELVAAGSGWSSRDGAVVALVALDEHERAATLPPAPPVAPAPVVAVAVATPPAVLHDRVAAVPPAPHPRPVRVAAAHDDAAPPAPIAHATPIPSDPYVDLKLAIRRVPLAFDPNIDGPNDAANEIARLKKTAYSPTTVGGEASAALYRIAVLLHKPLHQDSEALRTLELYRRRFSGGKELVPAMWLRVRIACGHQIDDECRKAAYSFQHDVRTGEAADVAIRITNAQ
ncbi:MAG TPA: FecR family protein [Kofleriaceae bacterium]|nr:FecR family protein [Kofleriaceae bacterium]